VTGREPNLLNGMQLYSAQALSRRAWLFCELRRDSLLPRPDKQTNLSFSRKGVIAAIHYHERGRTISSVCLQGTARIVLLDRDSSENLHARHRRENPVAVWVPGYRRARLRSPARLLFCYHVTEGIPIPKIQMSRVFRADRASSSSGQQSPILSARESIGAS